MAGVDPCGCDCPSFENEIGRISGILPTGYSHHVTRITWEDDVCNEPRFKLGMRLALSTREAAEEWLQQFQSSSLTTMAVGKTYPQCKMINVFKVDLRCHHNTRLKESNRLKKGDAHHTKNTDCPAIMTVTVKRILQRSRSKDPHLPSYLMSVSLTFTHNHPVGAADALKYRKVSEETREKFLDLFKAGHDPASALESHRQNLQERYGDGYDMVAADRAVCPDKGWCNRLFYSTFRKGYESLTRDGTVVTVADEEIDDDVLQADEERLTGDDIEVSEAVEEGMWICEDVTEEEDDARVIQEDYELLRRFDAFTERIRERLRDNPAEMRPALTRYLEQGEKLTTVAALSSALHCFGM